MGPVNNSQKAQIIYSGKTNIIHSIATTGCLLNVFTTPFMSRINITKPIIMIIVAPSMERLPPLSLFDLHSLGANM